MRCGASAVCFLDFLQEHLTYPRVFISSDIQSFSPWSRNNVRAAWIAGIPDASYNGAIVGTTRPMSDTSRDLMPAVVPTIGIRQPQKCIIASELLSATVVQIMACPTPLGTPMCLGDTVLILEIHWGHCTVLGKVLLLRSNPSSNKYFRRMLRLTLKCLPAVDDIDGTLLPSLHGLLP